ncbi:hypothetical protein P5673_004182 [Acropora cervicornis]|uniref:Uncharacterized protein n=1 Tax=Acropora cervicornis TaxID=6130 RepID=A0AAD9QZW9_ACRCE|nr:hypothetical protein P5673_004182 [Acropora cervicornis]
MGQSESRRCRICATRLNPKKKQDMQQSMCSSCRKKGSQAIWENRKTLRSFLFGEGSGGDKDKKKDKKEKKKKKKGKLKKLKKLRRKKRNK